MKKIAIETNDSDFKTVSNHSVYLKLNFNSYKQNNNSDETNFPFLVKIYH